MAPAIARNPASRFALTRPELTRMQPGTRLLVCVMSPYDNFGQTTRSVEVRIDSVKSVVLLGMRPRPRRSQYLGATYWVVLDCDLEISDYSMVKVGLLGKRYAYEPFSLGLVSARLMGNGDPVWDEMICIISPEHEQAFRETYPRRLPL